MPSSSIKAFRGFLIDSQSPGLLRGIRDGALLVEDGRILDAGDFERLRHLPEARGVTWQNPPSAVITPGLIDLHTHLPQYPAVARLESALLPWLEKHIFPVEKSFNAASARRQAPLFFEQAARNGTTTAAVFTAVFESSCRECFEAADRSGLRVIMGKMMMDRGSYGSLPPEKIATTSLDETKRLISRWHGHDNGRIEYAVSPRFAVTCTREIMEGAAALAKEAGCYIQTHLSENRDEIERVRLLFPECESYTQVYESCGLLGEKTLLGHGIHLAEEEQKLLADRGSIIVHCPTSNLFLRSGIMPMDRWRDAGIRLGLGSDVAAGPELNLWRVMRSALECQIARSFYETTDVPTPAELFDLATRGAAEALGKEKKLGNFDPGKEADFVVWNLQKILPPGGGHQQGHEDLDAEAILSLMIHRAGPEALVETFVRGRSVFCEAAPSLF
jgi:guanine deaminase